MKTTLQFIFLAILFLPNSSCLNKDPLFDGDCTSDCIIFLGKVTDPNNEPVPSEISIHHRGGGLFAIERLLGELDTDENGDFSFSFDGTNYKTAEGHFTISAHKEGYISDVYEGKSFFYNIDSTGFDVPNIANISLNPQANLELDITVDSPPEISAFNYSISYLNRNQGYYIADDSLLVSQSHNRIVGGDQSVALEYSYKKMGTTYSFEESIYIEAGETKKMGIVVE